MNSDYIFFLLGSAIISFMVGRTIMRLRKRKQEAALEAARRQAEALRRDEPSEAESKNKGKRRRQQQQAARAQGRR